DLSGMRPRPADRWVEGVQARVAAHADNVHPVAPGIATKLPDEQGAQSRCEETCRGYAAQEGDLGQPQARIRQRGFYRAGTQADAGPSMLVEQGALPLHDSGPVTVPARKSQVPAADPAVEEHRTNLGVGDLEAVEQVPLRVRVVGDGRPDPNDARRR